jgi:hypothetical protein
MTQLLRPEDPHRISPATAIQTASDTSSIGASNSGGSGMRSSTAPRGPSIDHGKRRVS